MKAIKYVVYREGDFFVSQCLNVDISSFGTTISEAVDNLREAVHLFFENNDTAPDVLTIEETMIGETFVNV